MSIDEFIEGNKEKLKLSLAFLLVFSLGFASGIFYGEPANSDRGFTITDGSAECASLLKSGGERQAEFSEEADIPAGEVLPDAASKAAASSQAALKLYASSKNSTLYHTRDCQYVKRIKEENIVWFGSQKEAQGTGKNPHTCISE